MGRRLCQAGHSVRQKQIMMRNAVQQYEVCVLSEPQAAEYRVKPYYEPSNRFKRRTARS